MAKAKPTVSGGAKVTQLQSLQSLVVEALTKDIENGLAVGEVNQASIKNALQLFRDNNIVCVDDRQSDYDRLASMLPPLQKIETTFSKYSG